jgi:hypothetical protein
MCDFPSLTMITRPLAGTLVVPLAQGSDARLFVGNLLVACDVGIPYTTLLHDYLSTVACYRSGMGSVVAKPRSRF